jgi:HPt (histidine-containing phosphotransfer) domain-containing protein
MWIAGLLMAEIDRSALDAHTGGDAELAREVLGLFAGECAALLGRMGDPAGDRTLRADAAHTLKGAAAGIGAHRVQALAGTAEARLRAGEAGAEEAVAALGEAVAAALAEIEAGD